MKKSYKLGLAAIAVSALLVGCGSDSTSTPTTPTTPTTPVEMTLQSFVSGNTFGGVDATVTFAADGAYHEEFQDDGYTGTCDGTWAVLSEDTLETTTTCSDDPETSSSLWEFIGELKSGMTVIITEEEGVFETTLTLL